MHVLLRHAEGEHLVALLPEAVAVAAHRLLNVGAQAVVGHARLREGWVEILVPVLLRAVVVGAELRLSADHTLAVLAVVEAVGAVEEVVLGLLDFGAELLKRNADERRHTHRGLHDARAHGRRQLAGGEAHDGLQCVGRRADGVALQVGGDHVEHSGGGAQIPHGVDGVAHRLVREPERAEHAVAAVETYALPEVEVVPPRLHRSRVGGPVGHDGQHLAQGLVQVEEHRALVVEQVQARP